MEKEEEKEEKTIYCPLISIGRPTLEPCIEEECMWFIKLWDKEKVDEIGVCAIKALTLPSERFKVLK